MADPAAVARAKIAALKTQISELEDFLAMYERLSGDAETSGAVDMHPVEMHSKQDDAGNVTLQRPVDKSGVKRHDDSESTPTRPRKRVPGSPRPDDIAALMERIIREVGRPMMRGEIVAALETRDVVIPYEDKSRYIGTIAWRNKGLFKNIEGRGYWLSGEPAPAPAISDAPPLKAPIEDELEF